jgi:hypothetical protein
MQLLVTHFHRTNYYHDFQELTDRQKILILALLYRQTLAAEGDNSQSTDLPTDSSTSGQNEESTGGQAMSYSISTLLISNLHDVFGENDPARRRAAIDEIFTEDCVFYEPGGVYHGRDAIDRVAGAIKATHPDFQYQPIAGPEELGNGGRVQWVSGRLGEPPAYAGTDFIIARDGRIAAVYLFFDKLP